MAVCTGETSLVEAVDEHFAHLSWPGVRELLDSERKTVLLFPVGATEPHGPHLPLATDPIISLGMCRRAAQALAGDAEMRALILPPLEFGVTRYAAGFPGAIHVSEETLLALVTDVCTSLIHQGFRYIVLVNNHFEPEHVQTIHRAIDAIERQTGVLLGYLDLTRGYRARRLTEEFRTLGSHAGRYETSLVLADRGELVEEGARRALPDRPVSLVEAIERGRNTFLAMGLDQAYNGSPAAASAEEGEESFRRLTEMLLEVIRDLVRGRGGRDQPGFYGRRPG